MKNRLGRIILGWTPVIIALVALLQGLWQFHHIGAAVFYGDDTFGHLENITLLKASSLYPTLNHPILLEWIVLQWCNLFHTDIVHTYSFAAILSLPAMILAISMLAYRVFNPTVGAWTALLLAFVSIQPVQNYQDGTIPDIYAIGVLFPLQLLTLHIALTNKKASQKWLSGIATVTLFFLILLTHHLSTLIAFITLLSATLLFTLWVATRLSTKRWLALLPLAGIVFSFWLLVAVIHPADALHLFKLVGSFDVHYPWFKFTHADGAQPAWNAVRYGKEVSGMIFQTALFGLALLIWRSWQEKKAGQAFIFLILASWLILYWLGSLSSLSFEPGRLARDFALPGSIIASYVIYWLSSNWWPKYKIGMSVFLLVLAVSAIFSTAHRLSLMTNQPKTDYTIQDEAVTTALKPYGNNVGIFSPNYYWQTIATARGHSYTTLNNFLEVQNFAMNHPSSCIVQLYYKIQIAGGNPDPAYATPVLLPTDYQQTVYEDSVRRLFLSCKPATIPSASTAQNIKTAWLRK